jgi:deoxyxylulose-5-phosphate synthase
VLGVPTQFIPHAKPDVILAKLGLDAAGIAQTVQSLITLN